MDFDDIKSSLFVRFVPGATSQIQPYCNCTGEISIKDRILIEEINNILNFLD